MRRIGIYSGTFDPIHAGHISFALQALQVADLDEMIFLPERQPRYKKGVEHFGHRSAMLHRAIKPYPKFSVIELTDRHFSVKRTIAQLQRLFPGAELVFLFGSDVVQHLSQWSDVERLLRHSLVVGVRGDESPELIREQLDRLSARPDRHYVIRSFAPKVSSGRIREAMRRRTSIPGTLPSVHRYANQNWLYVSVNSL
jgi:nicotinate-nucleotide adenylyltransferase